LRSKNVDSLSATHSNKTQTNREETNTQVSLCRAERRRKKEERKTYKTKKYKYTDNCKRKEREERWDNEREKYLLDRLDDGHFIPVKLRYYK
jgi:hypothetical protein